MNRRLRPIITFAAEAESEGGNDTGETPAGDEFKAITSQEDLNKILDERLKRERAKFGDYKDLKTKAAELDQIKQANQTEAQKAEERIAKLEEDLNATRLDALRRKVAGDHKITDQDDIDLFLTGEDEETLTRQAKRLADRDADRKKNNNVSPREGTNPPAGATSDEREFARQLFGQAQAE